jgi:hypothetical protein
VGKIVILSRRGATIGVRFGNPKFLVDSLANCEVFSLGDFQDRWCNVLCFYPLEPWCVPNNVSISYMVMLVAA